MLHVKRGAVCERREEGGCARKRIGWNERRERERRETNRERDRDRHREEIEKLILQPRATAKRAASKWLKLRKKNAPTRLAKQEAEHKGAMLHVQDKQTASAQRGYSSDNVSSDSNDDDDEDDDDNDKDGDNDDFKDHALEIPQRKSSQKKLHVPQRLSSVSAYDVNNCAMKAGTYEDTP